FYAPGIGSLGRQGMGRGARRGQQEKQERRAFEKHLGPVLVAKIEWKYRPGRTKQDAFRRWVRRLPRPQFSPRRTPDQFGSGGTPLPQGVCLTLDGLRRDICKAFLHGRTGPHPALLESQGMHWSLSSYP